MIDFLNKSYVRPIQNGDYIQPGTRLFFHITEELVTEIANNMPDTSENDLLFESTADSGFMMATFKSPASLPDMGIDVGIPYICFGNTATREMYAICDLSKVGDSTWTFPEGIQIEIDSWTNIEYCLNLLNNIYVDETTLYGYTGTACRPLQEGDYLTTGTELHFNFPNDFDYRTITPGSMDYSTLCGQFSSETGDARFEIRVTYHIVGGTFATDPCSINVYDDGATLILPDGQTYDTIYDGPGGTGINESSYAITLKEDVTENIRLNYINRTSFDEPIELENHYVMVDVSTLATSLEVDKGEEEPEQFGSIIKNGIAYNLIYKNGVQYTMIYLGGNRWWSYGTPPKTVYKRRLIIGDNLKGQTLYFDVNDEVLIQEINTWLSSQEGRYPSSMIFKLSDADGTALETIYLGASQLDTEGEYFVAIPGVSILQETPDINLWWGWNGANTDLTAGAVKIESGLVKSDQDYIVSDTDTDNCAYRGFYIKDPNIRPLEVGDYLDDNTVLYAVVPDDFYQISSNLTEGESINNTFVKVESDFSYAGGDTVVGYDIGINDQGTYVYLGAPYYDIYCYQTGEYEDFWNTSTFGIADLFDDGSNLFMENCIVIEVDKNDPYYKYVLVDETTLGMYPYKVITFDESIEDSSLGTPNYYYFNGVATITQDNLTTQQWIVETSSGEKRAGTWKQSNEPGMFGTLYYFSTDSNIMYEWISDTSCLCYNMGENTTLTLYRYMPAPPSPYA